jgi:hypothetical protein
VVSTLLKRYFVADFLSMDGAVVLQALTNACSQDPSVLKTAEEQLKSLETQPGFYNVLLV